MIVAGTVFGTLAVASLGAYSLARLDLPLERGIQFYRFLVIALPVQSFIVPLLFLWVKLGLINTIPGLILIYVALNTPFAELMVRAFLVGIPRELDDAARLDGATELQVARRIVLPLAWPGVMTVALVAGLAAYGELLFAVTVLLDQSQFPVSTAFLNFSQARASERSWSMRPR